MPDDAAQTVLGFDYGMRYIGVAVGQTVTATAQALETVHCHDGRPDWDRITRLIETWKPDRLVVGIPLNMDGSEQEMTDAARRFVRRLGGRFRLPVDGVDERLTTREASRILSEQGVPGHKLKNVVDAASAQIILESWFNQ